MNELFGLCSDDGWGAWGGACTIPLFGSKVHLHVSDHGHVRVDARNAFNLVYL